MGTTIWENFPQDIDTERGRILRNAMARREIVRGETMSLVGRYVSYILFPLDDGLGVLATHLEQALSLARSESFDFALLDINLNGKQSFPVADVTRACGLPFLFATGYGNRILDAPYRDAPILQKPFSLEELRRALERIDL